MTLLARPTTAEFIEWQESLGFTNWQVGILSQSSVDEGVGRAAARAKQGRASARSVTVEHWRRGRRIIPLATWELLQAKGFLYAHKLATFEELATIPLKTVLEAAFRACGTLSRQ